MSLQSKEPSVNFAKLIAADPDNVRHFDAISEEFCLQAVRIKGSSIRYIKNPSENVQMKAVQQDPRAIQYIKNPSAQIQLEACSRDNFAIDHIPKSQRLVTVEPVTGKYVIIPNKITPTELRISITGYMKIIGVWELHPLLKSNLYTMQDQIIEKLTEFEKQESQNK